MSEADSRTTLVVELAAALVEAGLPIHDCDARATDGTAEDATVSAGRGGVCLTPHPAGVLVSWVASDRLSLHTDRCVLEAAVRDIMAAAVTDVLTLCGFPVQPQPASNAVLVPVLQR